MTVRVRTELGVQTFVLDRQGDGWFVDAAGTRYWASLVPAGGGWSLLVGETPGGPARSYDVWFDSGRVSVDRRAVAARLLRPSARGDDHDDAAAVSGMVEVVSPMPGRVVKLLVKPGDVVDARQSLAIVEAMKMQNELKAPRAGTIAAVRVAEGAAVEARAVLLVLS